MKKEEENGMKKLYDKIATGLAGYVLYLKINVLLMFTFILIIYMHSSQLI
jgi:hypothetical protein